MEARFGCTQIFPGQVLSTTQIEDDLLIITPTPANDYGQTVALISDQKIIYLIVNVGTLQELILIAYQRPAPRSANIIKIYDQMRSIDLDVQNYDQLDWLKQPIFRQVAQLKFSVSGPSLRGGGSSYFKPDNQLTDKQQKWCRCVLHVGKQASANNPYAICSKSVGTSYRYCSDNYNWQGIPTDELQGYADRHGIEVPRPNDKTSIIQAIMNWKKTEKK